MKQMHAGSVTVGLFAVVGLVAGPLALSASAVTVNCWNPHCYSTAEWDSGGIYGGFDTVYVVNGSAADWSAGGHVNETLWVGTDNAAPIQRTYWIEVGYWYGSVAGYSGPGPNWYWADSRPGGGYHEHIPSGFSSPLNFLNQNISVSASYAGSSTWNIYIAGYSAGVSTSNPGVSDGLLTGLEVRSSSSSSYLNGSTDGSMEWQNSAGTWSSGWGSLTYTHVDSPLTGGWYITDHVWTNSLP